MRGRSKLLLASAATVVATAPLLFAGTASAHPLGNLAVNTYTGITVRTTSIEVDAVLDLAELPAVQARQSIDADNDTMVSEAEGAAYRSTQCASLAAGLRISAGRTVVTLASRALRRYSVSASGEPKPPP